MVLRMVGLAIEFPRHLVQNVEASSTSNMVLIANFKVLPTYNVEGHKIHSLGLHSQEVE